MTRDRVVAVGLLLVGAALAYLLGVHWWFVAGHRALARELDDLSEQAARFRSVIAQRSEIEAGLERVRAFEAANPAFLSDPNFDQASATLITRLRQSVEAHAGRSAQGCQVLSNQPLRPREAEPFLRVTLSVRLRCGPEALIAVLHDLEGGVPTLFVDELTVLTRRFGAPGMRQNFPGAPQDYTDVSFSLYGYLRQEGVAHAR
jgi:general secretion pathway protein M